MIKIDVTTGVDKTFGVDGFCSIADLQGRVSTRFIDSPNECMPIAGYSSLDAVPHGVS